MAFVTRPPLYGLDLVTSTTGGAPDPLAPQPGSIDPADDRILAAGLSLDGCERRFDGDERTLLAELDEFLTELPPGVLVSWYGSLVDLPVLAARAEALGVAVGLRLRPDRRDDRTAPAAGVGGTWCGAWHQHRHLDLARVYVDGGSRPRRRRARVPEGLIPPSDELTGHDPRHDAHLTRSLAERRWSRARRLVDRMPPAPGAGPRLARAPVSVRSA
jgi:hypothetical protein